MKRGERGIKHRQPFLSGLQQSGGKKKRNKNGGALASFPGVSFLVFFAPFVLPTLRIVSSSLLHLLLPFLIFSLSLSNASGTAHAIANCWFYFYLLGERRLPRS